MVVVFGVLSFQNLSENINPDIKLPSFSSYEINNSCELSLFFQDNIIQTKAVSHTNGFPLKNKEMLEMSAQETQDITNKWQNEAIKEVTGLEGNYLSPEEIQFIQENPDSKQAIEYKEKSEKLTEYSHSLTESESEVQFMLILEKYMEKKIDWIMETFSINPTLRSKVVVVSELSDEYAHYGPSNKALYNLYLLNSDDYQEDIECGKKYHQNFGDETYQVMVQLYGKEEADRRQAKIKEILYG